MQGPEPVEARPAGRGWHPRQIAGRLTRATAATLVLAFMAVGAFVLWMGIPAMWLWIASQMHPERISASMDQVVVVLVGMPVTMAMWAWVLFRADAWHARLTYRPVRMQRREAWMRSMRDDRGRQERTSPLDALLVISALIAIGAMAVWFFFFAEAPMPGG